MYTMRKPPISARIDKDTKKLLEKYKEEKGLNTSEATQRLLRQNLNIKYDEGEIPYPDGGEIKQKIDSTESEVQELSSQVEQDLTQNNLSYVFLTAGLGYIILQLSIGLPSELGLAVGIPLIIGLIWINFVR